MIGGGVFEQRDEEGIDFFPRGTAADPKTNRLIGRAIFEHAGKNFRFERVEQLGIAKEAGEADEQILFQGSQFFRMVAEKDKIILQGFDVIDQKAAADTAVDGPGFIEAEIKACIAAEQSENLAKCLLLVGTG